MRLDVLFHSGRITTLDDERPAAHALGVIGGRIVGLDEDVAGTPRRPGGARRRAAAVPPERIGDIEVVATVVGGEVLHGTGRLAGR